MGVLGVLGPLNAYILGVRMDLQVALRMNDLGVEGALGAGVEAINYAQEHGAPLPLGLLASSAHTYGTGLAALAYARADCASHPPAPMLCHAAVR